MALALRAGGRHEAGLGRQRKSHPLAADRSVGETVPVALPVATHLQEAKLDRGDSKTQPARGPVAETDQLAWLKRCRVGTSDRRSLPARRSRRACCTCRASYLSNTSLRPRRCDRILHVAMAAYGDYGPDYIGTAAAYGQGGYETSPRASGVDARAEPILMAAMKKLLEKK